ncbi:hypothetical protein ACGF5F_32695 [Streptomyces sp. NPDC047821]|uniref:hypothetical protein n=1 Tax=Streptomyces sp. NPDC047821 TaxID=3365488 RepID=UPI0037133FBF
MPYIVPREEAVIYDGTNGAYIANEWLGDATLVSDSGQVLRLKIDGWPPIQYDVPLGYYVLRYYGRTFHQAISAQDYTQNWLELPTGGA